MWICPSGSTTQLLCPNKLRKIPKYEISKRRSGLSCHCHNDRYRRKITKYLFLIYVVCLEMLFDMAMKGYNTTSIDSFGFINTGWARHVFGPTCMCCLLIILEYSDEDGAEGWIAPASHHRGTFPWLSGRCFVFYSLEIKLCSTLLCLKLNSAVLCSAGN